GQPLILTVLADHTHALRPALGRRRGKNSAGTAKARKEAKTRNFLKRKREGSENAKSDRNRKMGHGGMSWPSLVLSPLRSLRAFAQKTVSRFRLLSRFRSSYRRPCPRRDSAFAAPHGVQAENGAPQLRPARADQPRAAQH